jgi:integrase
VGAGSGSLKVMASSFLRLIGSVTVDHPWYAEAIDEHAKTRCPVGFLKRHYNPTAIGQFVKDALGVSRAINLKREREALWLFIFIRRYVAAHQLLVADCHAAVEQVFALLNVVGARARAGDLVGKRDYALLLLYITTGMRRNEVMSLQGKEVIVEEKRIIIRGRVKGGNYQGREVTDRRVRAALLDYLRSGRRLHVLREDQPLWTRHDGAGEPGAQLSSWSFVENLKRYAREAGIGKIHLHQTRHTFARMVARRSGSLSETQDALGHRHASTTRIYVDSIAVKLTSAVDTSSKPWNCRTSKAISLRTPATTMRRTMCCGMLWRKRGFPI